LKRFDELNMNNGAYSLNEVGTLFGTPVSINQFLPGRFYSLKAESPLPVLNENSVSLINDGKDYYDLSPVGLVLFHENWKEKTLMLNLKVIPTAFSKKILEAYYFLALQNGFSKIFDQEGILKPLEERLLLDQRFYFVTPSVISEFLGVQSLGYAINKYSTESILEAKLIDWNQFGMLINPRISNSGLFPEPANLEEIWDTFLKKFI
jgi:hypothetical protein